MRKLLVPVDSSDCAIRALQHALHLARDNGPLSLHIVNAHDFPLVYGEIAIHLPEEKAKALQRQHSEDILEPALKLARAAGVAFTSEILIGDVPKVIAECAERQGCDAIVMGTRGLGAIASLVLGSIATKVVHLSHVPVTLVK